MMKYSDISSLRLLARHIGIKTAGNDIACAAAEEGVNASISITASCIAGAAQHKTYRGDAAGDENSCGET